jgi:signal transduction histidine kinase
MHQQPQFEHNQIGSGSEQLEQGKGQSSASITQLAEVNAQMAVEIKELRQANAELLQRHRELLSLQSAAAATASSLELMFVLETVTWEMANLLEIECCAVYEWNRETNVVSRVAEYSTSGWLEPGSEVESYSLADYPAKERLLLERNTLQMTISQTDVDPTELAYMQQAKITSLLMLPLVFQDRVVGLVKGEDSREERTFTGYEISLAQALISQAASAIENARLYEQAKHEIAQRMQAEEKLEEYTAELERSNQELQQFAYVASHDLQEPLRMVTSYLQLLELRYQDRLDADALEFIAFAVEGATRMHELIQGLLAYSRVGTHGAPLQRSDTEATLALTLDNLQVAIEESGAVVTHDPLPAVMADPIQLGQLLQNLIGNAIKFRGKKVPYVHIGAERTESDDGRAQWLFSVRDNGIGIDPQYGERIFLIFQRLHARDEYPGTGIGLALCKRIVERHGGRIWVESQPREGSTFYFTLPPAGEQPTP